MKKPGLPNPLTGGNRIFQVERIDLKNSRLQLSE